MFLFQFWSQKFNLFLNKLSQSIGINGPFGDEHPCHQRVQLKLKLKIADSCCHVKHDDFEKNYKEDTPEHSG